MRTDGDGRYCERCQLRVTDVASLDVDGLDTLLAAGGRACARFELVDGHPRTKLGLAAGLVVMALAGCATPGTATTDTMSEQAFAAFIEAELGTDVSGGLISGVVRSNNGVPIANALVILQSNPLANDREQLTNEQGFYAFKQLPAGSYTIQVLYAEANVVKVIQLPVDARFRANFSLDPENNPIMLGMVSERPMIDTSSASSTYSSRMIEYR
jgi:hypothetical protein